MGGVKIIYPNDPYFALKKNRRAAWFYDSRGFVDDYVPFIPSKREMSIKSIIRRIRKQHYPKGTRFVFHNWYVGYANIMITI